MITVVLLFVAIGFGLIFKHSDKINWILFVFHFLLTIPAIIYLKFPTILLDITFTNQSELIKAIEFGMKLIPVAWIFFIIGQILFLIYFTRAIKATPNYIRPQAPKSFIKTSVDGRNSAAVILIIFY